jgi:hypothetical protein
MFAQRLIFAPQIDSRVYSDQRRPALLGEQKRGPSSETDDAVHGMSQT